MNEYEKELYSKREDNFKIRIDELDNENSESAKELGKMKLLLQEQILRNLELIDVNNELRKRAEWYKEVAETRMITKCPSCGSMEVVWDGQYFKCIKCFHKSSKGVVSFK